MLRAHRRGKKETAYVFNELQAEALKKLWDALRQQVNDSIDQSELEDCLYTLFNEVYFLQGQAATTKEFDMPSTAFLALQCVAEDGSFVSIYHIPPVIAKLQYCFRLRGIHNIMLLRKPETSLDDFSECVNLACVKQFLLISHFRLCNQFFAKNLQDYNLTPFATLRSILHKTSVVSKKTPRPDMVWWHGQTVTVGETEVDMDIYKAYLTKKLGETEKFIEENVLLNTMTVENLDESCKLSHIRDLSQKQDILHNGILLDLQDGSFDNPESGLLFLEFLKQGKLATQTDGSESLRFDGGEGTKWLLNIDAALTAVQALCHVTQGPGVGQMTEQALQSPINTRNTSRNFVIENGTRTGAFRTGYDKGSSNTGHHKEILRLLPYRVFRLLWILIRAVRPIEFAVLCALFIQPNQQRLSVDVYREWIWASWGRAWTPIRLSNNLQKFMKEGMGIKMGARIYRHFAIAVQRHYPQINYSRYKTEKEEKMEVLALASDLMAGHTSDVADQNYTRIRSVLSTPKLVEAYVQVCQDWHAFLGFSTSNQTTVDVVMS